MASDFDDIREELLSQREEPNSGQALFVFLLVSVLAIGAVIGYMVLPRDSGPQAIQMASVSETTPAEPAKAKTYKTSDLKKLRLSEMRKFRNTQAELRNCAPPESRVNIALDTYTNRNQAAYTAWSDLFDNTEKLAKMNGLESSAYILTGSMQNDVKDVFADMAVELNAHDSKVDPIKCGQLNGEVQRRQRDLDFPPSS